MTTPDPNAIFNEDPKVTNGDVIPEDNNSDVPKNTDDPAPQEPSPLDKWVGEGKKYATVEQAVEALSHSQDFIEQLKQENAGLRRELSSQEKLDELLSRIGTSETPSHKGGGNGMEGAALETPDGAGQDGGKKQSFTQEELSELVRSEVTRMEEKRTAEQNELEASNKIVELADGDGAKATQFVKQAAEELGVSVRYLRQQAQISPSAFVRLVSATATKGNDAGKEAPNVVSGRGQNTEALPNQGARPSGSDVQPYSHWKKLRKEISAREYYSPKVQNAMMRSRQQLGEAFYDA